MSKYMPITYLDSGDFNSDMSLKNYVGSEKNVIIMVQGNFCGYCTSAKPDFITFSKQCQNAVCFTLQIDDDLAKDVASKIKLLDKNYQGVPIYLGFKNGKYVKTHSGGRDVVSLIEFAKNL